MCKPSRNGKEGRVYPGVGGALLLLLLLAVCVCSECTGEGREIEGLVAIILRARPVRWVSLRPCTAYSAGAASFVIQRWLALEVRPPLNPVLVACHRYKRTQADPGSH